MVTKTIGSNFARTDDEVLDTTNSNYSQGRLVTGSSTPDVIVADTSPGTTVLVDQQQITIELDHGSNTIVNPTFQLGTTATKTIVKGAGDPLDFNDTGGSGYSIILKYSSALDEWVLLNPIPKKVIYDNLSDALNGPERLGAFVETAEYNDGTGTGGELYEIVPGGTGTPDAGTFIDKTDGSGLQFKLITNGLLTFDSFGVDLTGGTENSEKVRAALLAGSVIPSNGIILVNPSTPIIIDSTKNKLFKGAAKDVLEFETTIDDGSVIFQCTGQWDTIEDFSINGVGGSPFNYVGFQFGNQTAGNSLTRSSTKLKGSFCNGTVFDFRGWVNDHDLFTTNSARGFKGRELNASTLRFRSENDLRAIDLEETFGTFIDQLLIENTGTLANTNPSRIDQFRGVTVGALYMEGDSATTKLEIGQSIKGVSFSINGGSISGLTTDLSPMISFVNAESVVASIDIAVGSNPIVANFSASCDYVESLIVGNWSALEAKRNKLFTQDNSLSVQIHENFSGDTYFDHFLATFPTISIANVVVTEENTIIRSGDKAVRITVDSGTNQNLVQLHRTIADFPSMSKLSGKTIKAFAWIFTPSLTAYNDYSMKPALGFSVNGAASSFPTAQVACAANGQWTLIESEDLTVPSGWGAAGGDRLNLELWANATNTNAPNGTYHIIVDSIFITDTNTNIRDIMSGRFRESGKYMGISTDGTTLKIRSNTYQGLTATHITLVDGEVDVSTDAPAAGGVIGYGVTTAGTLGGTAVFKSKGNFAA